MDSEMSCSTGISMLVHVYIFSLVYGVFSLTGRSLYEQQAVQVCRGTARCPRETDMPSECCAACKCTRDCVRSLNCCPDAGFNRSEMTTDKYDAFMTCELNFVDNKALQNMLQNVNKSMRLYKLVRYRVVTISPDGRSCKQLHTNQHASGIYFVSDKQTGVIFFNKRCAENHGIKNVLEWSTFQLEGCEKLFLYRGTKQDYLRFYYSECLLAMKEHPSDVTSGLYACNDQRCNATGLWSTYDPLLVELCENPIYGAMNSVFWSMHHVYSNPFCLLCNIPTPGYILNDICTLDTDASLDIVDMESIFSLQIGQWGTEAGTPECGELQILDTITNVCRDLFCPFSTIPHYGECQPSPFDFKEFVFVMHFLFSPKTNTTQIDDHAEVDDYFVRHLELLIPGPLFQATTRMYRNATTREVLFYSTFEFLYEALLYMEQMPNIERQVNWGYTFTSVFIDGDEYLYEVKMVENVQYKQFPTQQGIELFPWMRADENLAITDIRVISSYTGSIANYIKHIEPAFLVELSFPYNCSYISLRLDDFCHFPFIFHDSVSSFPNVPPKMNEYFYPGTFYVKGNLENVLKICVNDYVRIFKQYFDPYSDLCATNQNTLTQILSLTLTLASLICILAVFVIILRRRFPRSEPEVMFVISLGTTFFAQITFQFLSLARGHTALCSFIGMSVHYLWIAAVFSQGVYCALISVNLQCLHRKAFSSKLVVGLLCSHVLPIVFIAITVIYAQTDDEPRTHLGYGEQFGLCHIDNRILRATLFALPILITVLFSLVVYAYIAFKIETITFHGVLERPRYPYLLTYIRLLTVTGATWSFGLVNELIKSDVLHYIFIFLVGGQGVVLFLSFSKTLCCCKRQTRSIQNQFKIPSLRSKRPKTVNAALTTS